MIIRSRYLLSRHSRKDHQGRFEDLSWSVSRSEEESSTYFRRVVAISMIDSVLGLPGLMLYVFDYLEGLPQLHASRVGKIPRVGSMF